MTLHSVHRGFVRQSVEAGAGDVVRRVVEPYPKKFWISETGDGDKNL